MAQHGDRGVVVRVVRGEVVGEQPRGGDHVVAEEQDPWPDAGGGPEVAGPARPAVGLDQHLVRGEVAGDVEVVAVDDDHHLRARQGLGGQPGQRAPQDVPPVAGGDDDHQVVGAGATAHRVADPVGP